MKFGTQMLRYFSLLFCLVLSLNSCGGEGGEQPNTLRLNLGAEPPSLDWHQATDNASFDVLCNVMVGLTQYTAKLTVEPGIAQSWDVLDGGKRYVFHLRKNALWSDGKPVVAGDFEYAWKRLLDPQTAGPYAFFLYSIHNAEAYNRGKLKDASQVGVRALDDKTLEVRLDKPTAYFLYLTAYGPAYPARRDAIEKFGSRWTEPDNIVTDGPFLLKKWEHEYKIELAANPHYFAGEPKVKHVKMFMVPEQSTAFALYENNELDYVDNRSMSTPDIERNKDSKEYVQFPVLRNVYFGFNVTKAPFKDPRVRKAFSMAIDRTVFPLYGKRGQTPLFTWIPPQLPGYSPDSAIKYDPAAARKLLAEAGYPDGKNFPDLTLKFPYREDTQLIVEAFQDQVKRNLNVRVGLENSEWKVFLSQLKRDAPPLFYSSWGADYPDPETFANLFTSYNGNNELKYRNPQYDRLVEAAEGELDPAKRMDYYKQADKLLVVQDAALAPAYQAAQNMMIKPWVHGISKNAIDVQFLKDVYLDPH
jgi:oligopeptide transport system substrate-binding protein